MTTLAVWETTTYCRITVKKNFFKQFLLDFLLLFRTGSKEAFQLFNLWLNLSCARLPRFVQPMRLFLISHFVYTLSSSEKFTIIRKTTLVYKYRPFTSLLPVHTTIFHTCNDFQLQVHSKDTYATNTSRTKAILQKAQVLTLYLPSGLFCNVWLFCCCCLLECQSVFRESATTEGINFNSRYSFWVPPIRRWMFFYDRSFLAGFFTYNKVMLIWLSRYLSYIERER